MCSELWLIAGRLIAPIEPPLVILIYKVKQFTLDNTVERASY